LIFLDFSPFFVRALEVSLGFMKPARRFARAGKPIGQGVGPITLKSR
jgi:hypothetical protein